VHHEPAAVERGQRAGQRGRSVQAVEVEDGMPPQRAEHARGLVRPRRGAGGDDQVVVAEPLPVGEQHDIRLGIDPVDLAEHQIDASSDELPARLDDLLR